MKFFTITAISLLAKAMLLSGMVAEDSEPHALSHEYLFAPNPDYPYFRAPVNAPDPSTRAFSKETAAFLAHCSYLIYVKDPEFIRCTLSGADFGDVRFFEEEGTFAFLAQRKDTLVLCFRGSETGDRTDYLTDAKIVQRKFGKTGTAHSGFIDALEVVDQQILEAIQALLSEGPKNLLITGHSLGGALGTLFTLKNPELPSTIYTYGAPRVGGKKLARHADEIDIPLYRIVSDNDLIPRLPTPPFYHHAGKMIFIDSSGELSTDPTFSEKWESRASGHGAYFKRLLNEHWLEGEFNAIPTDYFADHSPRLYCERLEELLRASSSPSGDSPQN